MKKIKIFLVLFLLGSLTHAVFAQVKLVTGTVTSDGDVLPGVTVVIKGTEKGTTTDFNGKYEIQASPEDVLVFSFVGMKPQEIKVGGKLHINVDMQESAEALKKVIVTALGIKKQRKSLTYAAQDLKSDELKRVKQTNPINSLSGKIAGLTINRNASGAGGSVKVVLRGNSSMGNNNPLYVVDGVPLTDTFEYTYKANSTFGDKSGGNRDGGDPLSLINPDDIESISVLKGASASALYGSRGLNGVVLITTKKGKKGGMKVNVSSSLTMDKPAYMMTFYPDAQNNVDNFFQTGKTNINSFSLSGGTEVAQTYFSYSNTLAAGVLPTNDLTQHTLNLRETAQYDRIKLNGAIMFSKQEINNRPVTGLYYNPLVGVYNYDATQGPLSDWENFEEFDPGRNLMKQRWFRPTSDIEQNPYWIINRNPSLDNNDKLMINTGISYKLTDHIDIQARGVYDNQNTNYERRIYATSNGTLSHENGRFIKSNLNATQWFGDIMAMFKYKLNNDINFNAILGSSLSHSLYDIFYADSGNTGGLQYANVFAIQNFNANPNVDIHEKHLQKKISSVFFSSTMGYKDQWYLDLTARNDWTSSLAKDYRSYFYPSIGLTGILSNIMKLGDKVSFAKVRASYAEVGHDVPANTLYSNRIIHFGGGVSGSNPPRPLGEVPPERQRSFEIGTEWRFNNDNLGIDIGYYKTNTVNQYLYVGTSAGSAHGTSAGASSGDIQNTGWEITAFAYPVKKDDLKWKTDINFATNKNTIIEISKPEDAEVSYAIITDPGVNSYGMFLVEGGSYGDIYGMVVKKDSEGRTIVDRENDNAIQKYDDPDNTIKGLKKVGNANPDFTLGWNNHFDYKNFGVDFLIDGRFGGVTMSMTEAVVEGMSDNSAREQSNENVEVVDLDGNPFQMSAKDYYGSVGGRNGFTGEYVYDATNIRLAELALSYKFKLNKLGMKNVKMSIIGNNLFFFYKKAPYDPNISATIGNGLQGLDLIGIPSSRSIGFNINLTF